MRPRCRSLKVAGPGQGVRQIGTPCRVRLDIYLVDYGRERGEGGKRRETGRERGQKGRRERGRKKGEGKKWEKGRHKICLFEKEAEKEGTQAVS